MTVPASTKIKNLIEMIKDYDEKTAIDQYTDTDEAHELLSRIGAILSSTLCPYIVHAYIDDTFAKIGVEAVNESDAYDVVNEMFSGREFDVSDINYDGKARKPHAAADVLSRKRDSETAVHHPDTNTDPV